MYQKFRNHWFLAGVLIITGFVLLNPLELASSITSHLKAIHFNTFGIAVIFFISGLELKWDHLIEALQDWKGTLIALISIFVLAPFLAGLISFIPAPDGIAIGLMLISIVPTTLASGVVMSQIAGGRTAHAIIITILANLLGVLVVPLELSIWIHSKGLQINFPYREVSLNLLGLVLLPLILGMFLRYRLAQILNKIPFSLNILSRCVILGILFLGLHYGRTNILHNFQNVFYAGMIAMGLHLILATVLGKILIQLQWKTERCISIFMMGIQKTLPLSVWLQITFFPNDGLALVVCLFYHIGQLFLDQSLIERFQKVSKKSQRL